MVEFDRSHYRLFDRTHDNNAMQTSYLGGTVESVKCEMVDISTEVANNNGHISTMHMSQCVSDKCNSNRECRFNLGGQLFCSKRDMTCQMGRFLNLGAECTEDNQCHEGYCTEDNGQMKCMPKRALNDLCSSSAECVTGEVCCDQAGGSRCNRNLCQAEVVHDNTGNTGMCMTTGVECSEHSTCCSGSCMFDPMLVLGQCM